MPRFRSSAKAFSIYSLEGSILILDYAKELYTTKLDILASDIAGPLVANISKILSSKLSAILLTFCYLIYSLSSSTRYFLLDNIIRLLSIVCSLYSPGFNLLYTDALLAELISTSVLSLYI